MEYQLIECSRIEFPKADGAVRTFSKESAEKLAESIKIDGLLQPIGVRPDPDKPGHFLGVMGKHRLYAKAKILKEQFIECNVFEDMDSVEAELASITENLWKNPLSKAQAAIALKRWLAHYQAKYPEAVGRGAAGRKAAKEKRDAAKTAVVIPVDAEVAPEVDPTAVEPPKKVESFAKHVSDLTGESLATTKRAQKIATAFSEDQLEIFHQNEVCQTDMEAMSKIKDEKQRSEVCSLVAGGFEPVEAMKEVLGDQAPIRSGHEPAKIEEKAAKQEAAKEEQSDMSDEEWYATYCEDRGKLFVDDSRFRADALLYRAITEARHVFRVKVKKALATSKKVGATGPLYRLIYKCVSLSHPRNWLICHECRGTGQAPTGGQCKTCYGACYLLKTEEYL